MELLGAALPNVMFLVGVLAIGLGLGIELKVVSLNKEINRTGRIGAFTIGIALIAASVLIYLNPSSNNRSAASATPGVPTPISATAAPAPTMLPPTPIPTAQPLVSVPDIHDKTDKDIDKLLEGTQLLKGQKRETCEGSDQGQGKPKKGRVLCQNPAAGQQVAPGTSIDYVLQK